VTASQWLANNLADVLVAVARAQTTLAAQSPSQPAMAVQAQEVSPDA
jgi:hypothetical protein